MSNLKNHLSNIWLVVYIIGIVSLLFYSFTQIDLSLTLSRASFVQDFEKAFQYIGYFNRPLSTYLFVGITIFLYIIYIKLYVTAKEFALKKIWLVIICTAVLLGIAYNAFSYDLFNYIFDAKIVTHYYLNPYEHKALDFPNEPMLSFMRWTHRVYPYGPLWLGITIPLSFIGFNYFLLTFFIFKALMVSAFLGCVWVLKKIMYLTDEKSTSVALIYFALNPFVLIESIVSGHNDIVMILFMLVALFFLIKKHYVFTFFALVAFYGIKFATPELPLYIHGVVLVGVACGLFLFSKISKRFSWNTIFILGGSFMIIPIVIASLRTNFQPWYLLSLMPFAALLSKNKAIALPLCVLSFFALGEYVPYLYLGNWDPPVPFYLLTIREVGIGLSIITFFCIILLQRKKMVK